MNNPFDTIDKRLSNLEALLLEVKNSSNEIKQNFTPKEPTEYLTRAEVADMLKVDLSTLWKWQKIGKLIPYGIGNRVYFKRSDIEAALIAFGKNRGGVDE